MSEQKVVRQQQAERDADLRDAVLRKIFRDTIVRESHVNLDVSVADGVVTLSGAVLGTLMAKLLLPVVTRLVLGT